MSYSTKEETEKPKPDFYNEAKQQWEAWTLEEKKEFMKKEFPEQGWLERVNTAKEKEFIHIFRYVQQAVEAHVSQKEGGSK